MSEVMRRAQTPLPTPPPSWDLNRYLNPGFSLRFDRHVGLRARPVDGLPMRQLAQNRLGRGQSVLVGERLVDVLVTE